MLYYCENNFVSIDVSIVLDRVDLVVGVLVDVVVGVVVLVLVGVVVGVVLDVVVFVVVYGFGSYEIVFTIKQFYFYFLIQNHAIFFDEINYYSFFLYAMETNDLLLF